ncbi:MAG: DNA (cytosine-5-)-methyltransferase [Clostridia bacterium]|nr:DNA (cytosine-5-)-methyltransferase [Clostridia bacterium]
MASDHRFPWKWWLRDLQKIEKNGLKVFSCFSCGGGSSMGYKLAGYEVIGNVEIDPRVMEVYQKNNHPKHSYLMDVRDFLKIQDDQLPDDLFRLDILDGSPPCSVFSTAGDREKGWNKEKVFREGQAKQKLDDLFFYFIRIAEKLQPRVVIAENVKGLIKGNARGYVNEIFKAFDAAGYKVQLFLLNSAFMGVPQKRERCFFIAQRKDQGFKKLSLQFNEQPILFREVRDEHGLEPQDGIYKELLKQRIPTDTCIADISKRVRGRDTGFNNIIIRDNEVAGTMTSGGSFYRMVDAKLPTENDYRNCQTFPQDYDFKPETAKYLCGMSVPPVMMAQIAAQISDQWFMA